jgi:hypothetical protein
LKSRLGAPDQHVTFADAKREKKITYAIFKAFKKIVNGSSSRFERQELFVRRIFANGFFYLTFSFYRFVDRALHVFELLLDRTHARLNGGKKVCSLQLCEALHLTVTARYKNPKCWSESLQQILCKKSTTTNERRATLTLKRCSSRIISRSSGSAAARMNLNANQQSMQKRKPDGN